MVPKFSCNTRPTVTGSMRPVSMIECMIPEQRSMCHGMLWQSLKGVLPREESGRDSCLDSSLFVYPTEITVIHLFRVHKGHVRWEGTSQIHKSTCDTLMLRNSTKNSPVTAGWNRQLLAKWIEKILFKRYVWPKKGLNSTFWFVTWSRLWVLLTWCVAADVVRGRFITLPHAQ